MKMKAVCDATGLTRKTILFYEEQEFIAPEKTRMNGRDYREYSQADVETLKEIAALRKCSFSIEEIRCMRSNTSAVREVFLAYRSRLQQQKAELDQLLQTVETVTEDRLSDIHTLLDALREPSQDLPLPQSDREPHFRHLDEMEADLNGPQPVPRYHTDARPVEIDQDHIIMDKRYGIKKLLDDTKSDMQEIPRYRVAEEKSSPFWLSILKGVIIVTMILFFFDLFTAATNKGLISEWALFDLGILAGLAVLIFVITLIQRRWKRRRH